MKKILINLFAVVAIALSLSSCGYNSIVEKQEAAISSLAQVETEYQRRMDLIPNIVKVAQQNAKFEQQTLIGVVEARKYASDVKIDGSKMSQEDIDKYQQAQQSLSGALGRFLSVAEAYPDLKASEGYMNLMTELEGSENRITVARVRFNNAVNDYNTYIRKFPNNFTAGWFDFEKMGYFKADPAAAKAPEVKFE